MLQFKRQHNLEEIILEGYTRAPTQFDLKSVHRLTRQIPNCSKVWQEVKRKNQNNNDSKLSVLSGSDFLFEFLMFQFDHHATNMPANGPSPRASSLVAMPPENYCEALQGTCKRAFLFGEGPFRFHVNFHESSGVLC